MIANERQYRITRTAAREFEEALARLETVEAHRAAIRDTRPELEPLYDVLAEATKA